MRKKHARRRASIIRVVLLGFAVSLGMYAIVQAPPALLIAGASKMLANAVVGMSAGVPENPYNSLAQELAAKEASLNERESAMTTRLEKNSGEPSLLTIYSFILSGVLFVLLLLNYYFDWRRSHRRESGAQIVVR